MQLTRKQLKQIISEEIETVSNEQDKVESLLESYCAGYGSKKDTVPKEALIDFLEVLKESEIPYYAVKEFMASMPQKPVVELLSEVVGGLQEWDDEPDMGTDTYEPPAGNREDPHDSIFSEDFNYWWDPEGGPNLKGGWALRDGESEPCYCETGSLRNCPLHKPFQDKFGNLRDIDGNPVDFDGKPVEFDVNIFRKKKIPKK
jgi:hypothetical protein